MKSPILVLLFLLVVCVSLPFLFTFAEGMTNKAYQDILDKVDPKKQSDYSRTMDPEDDIPTAGEDLDPKFFDTIHTGSYYEDDGEDESKYHNCRQESRNHFSKCKRS